MTVPVGRDVWRKYEIANIPASGPHRPVKEEIITWTNWWESLLQMGGAGLVYTSLAALNADLAHAANTGAFVRGDATAANDGLYHKVGGSGSGSWTRIGDLPESLVRLTVTGGTANAIVATATEVPTLPGNKLYILTPSVANTGPTTVNGSQVKNLVGLDLAANSLMPGIPVLMAWQTDHYQLMTSLPVDADSILAAVLAAQSAAAASASAAAQSAIDAAGYAGTFLQAGTGAVSRSIQNKARDIVNAADFGAVGDAVDVAATVSITSGAAALTAVGASFASGDVGKSIVVPGAGAAGADLLTTISAFTDATHVTLAANASTTLSAASKIVTYGSDNTTKLQNAVDEAVARGGGLVQIQPGRFMVSDDVTINAPHVFIEGAGMFGSAAYGGTEIVLCTATQNGFVFNSNGQPANTVRCGGISKLAISAGVTKTFGSAVQLNVCFLMSVRDLFLASQYIGIDDGSSFSDIHGNYIDSAISVGIKLRGGGTGGNVDFNIVNSGTTSPIGVQILSGVNGAIITRNQVLHCAKGLNITDGDKPDGTGVIQWLFFHANAWDSNTGRGAEIATNGGGIIEGILMHEEWFASSANEGLVLSATSGGTIKGVSLVGPLIANNGTTGASFFGVQDLSIVGPQVAGNSWVTPGSTHGLYFNGSTHVTVTGGWSRPAGRFINGQVYGIVFDTGCDHASVVGVDVSGNLTGGILNSGGGADIRFTNNVGYVNANSGLASATTDGNGDITITHGLSGTPTKVWLQLQTPAGGYSMFRNGVSSTSIQARAFVTSTGAGVASTAVTVAWRAEL